MLSTHFDLAGRAQLSRLPEGVVQIGELLQVLRLKVVRPQDEELIFRDLGLLFFNGHVARERILVSRIARLGFEVQQLFGHGYHRFSGDPRRGGVVHTAGAIAVGADRGGGKLTLEFGNNVLQHSALRSVSFQQRSDVFARKAVPLANGLTLAET
jgi:hypothetical protein